MIEFNGKSYRVDGANIVDNKTNIVVCQEVATMICNLHTIVLAKREDSVGGRIDTAYLNERVKRLLSK